MKELADLSLLDAGPAKDPWPGGRGDGVPGYPAEHQTGRSSEAPHEGALQALLQALPGHLSRNCTLPAAHRNQRHHVRFSLPMDVPLTDLF